MQTESGICLNLKESSYSYDFLGFKFYFSSLFYLNKFKLGVKDFIEIESLKFANKYDIPIALNRYFAICFYKRTEKRGFRIFDTEKNHDLERIFFISNLI